MTSPMLRDTPRRSFLAAPQTRATIAAAAVLLAIIAIAAAMDPSGLLAPIGGRGLPFVGTGGVYQWAPLAVGLPVLLVGTVLPILVLGQRLRARWLFASTWVAVVGAGAWATAATGFVSASPMLGAHLSVGSALQYAVSTSGFAAIKYLILGALVSAAAAVAARFGPRPGPKDNTGTGEPLPAIFSLVVMTAVAALAAVGPAAHWWRGGPVGYAFDGFLVAPTAAASVPGFLAGMAVFLASLAAMGRTAQRRLSDAGPLPAAVSVYLAAVVSGLGLGVVDAAVAAMPFSTRLPDAGPDAWWLSTSLISIATGIGYGAAVGLAGAAVLSIAWRIRSIVQVGPGARPRLVTVGAVLALLLALAPAIGTSLPAGPPAMPAVAGAVSGAVSGAATMERLQVLPAGDDVPTIGDVTGRQVILRGVNVNQLIDYYLRDPAIPATQPLTDDDFQQMAAMGFNVMRLGMSWSRLEPERGTFDKAYLREVKAAVAGAKARGIYTVLDMHEDAWGNALAQPSEQCGGGTTPTNGWDGAPAWATITDGTAHCQFMARDLAPAVATAFANFYTDRDGIQTELVRTWAFVADAFAGDPAVAGYDLLNEPGIGANPPISSGLLLGRYYDAAITAIRRSERIAGGFAHLVFFEPSVLWSGLGFDATPPPGFTDDRQLVFAPHPYSESISMDQSLGLTIASIERNLTVSTRAAAAYGAALWLGEWGWFGSPSTDGAKVWRFGAAQDRLGLGGAFWVWRQGCGSPETGDDATTSGNLVRVDCRTGESLPPPAEFAQPLSRAYPRAVPGRLDSVRSDPGGALTVAATADSDPANCQVDIWVPGEPEPSLTTSGSVTLSATKVAGGWRITGCARGPYTITAEQ